MMRMRRRASELIAFGVLFTATAMLSVGSMAVDCEQARVDRVDSPGFFQRRECGEESRPQQSKPTRPAPGSPVAPEALQSADGVNLEREDTGLWHAWTEFRLEDGGTGGSLNFAIAALVRKMIEQCKNGWEKRREWGLSGTGAFELHYQFACLGKPE